MTVQNEHSGTVEANYLHGNVFRKLNIACSVKWRYDKQTLVPSMYSCKPHYLCESSARFLYILLMYRNT